MRTRQCSAFCLGMLHDDDKPTSAVSAYANKRGVYGTLSMMRTLQALVKTTVSRMSEGDCEGYD